MEELKKYKRTLNKLVKAEDSWTFLKECKINCVFPMSIFRINLPVFSKKVIQNTKTICLRTAISEAKRRFYKLRNQSLSIKAQICSTNDCNLHRHIETIERWTHDFKRHLRRKHIKKLKWILSKQLRHKKNRSLPIDEVLTDLDDIEVPNFVKEVIQASPACAILEHNDILQNIPAVEKVMQPFSDLEAEHSRWTFIAEHKKKHLHKNVSPKAALCPNYYNVNQVLSWLLRAEITLTREDKSKKLVMLKKDTYERFIQQFIIDSKADTLTKDPTLKLDAAVSKFIKNPMLPSFLDKKRVPNPACPRIFTYIKTHKDPISARPIVEKFRSPTYYLEKTVAKWCQSKLDDYPYTINSSQEFLGRLRLVNTNGAEVMSVLDFESLYPSLNLNATCLFFYRFLLRFTPENERDPKVLRELAYLLCHESYFEFKGQFYHQTIGVPIGSPVAGALAEIIVREIEGQLSPTIRNEMMTIFLYFGKAKALQLI